jgi:hypothetical protein
MSSAGTFPILCVESVSLEPLSYISGAPERWSMRMQCRELGLPNGTALDQPYLAGSAPENLTAVNTGPSRRNMLTYGESP